MKGISAKNSRLTLAKNACGQAHSPQTIRESLCSNPCERQAHLEINEDDVTSVAKLRLEPATPV
jgi:hypothetical protein